MSSQKHARGTAALEFALVVPFVLLVLLGGVHITMLHLRRNALAEATTYAARSMAIAQETNPGVAVGIITNRMGATALECGGGISVAAAVLPGSFPHGSGFGALYGKSLQLTSTCNLAPGFGIGSVPVSALATFNF